ncbi:hypothetical protein DESUT3_39670 [Desulfuromonas versatilis]|uniref:Cytochrome c domain-containing protein n=1 Tax=Desulfuromonas versatilis TaxID=2802975 RepID=A0ABM8I2T2_9BACT|nr:MopE-related protein [Desulfuromonas versatilis]BCR06898.1 hypothetical protein DESUT3_39670 [Desulfuromonas versatilis]
MKKPLGLVLAVLLLSASGAFGFGSIGNQVNANCPSQPYTGDCALCHTSNRGASTPAKDAAAIGNWSFFCPPVDPNTIDSDMDGFTPNQGDCNDANAAVNPGAVENCTDGVDNNCDGLTDTQDTQACPAAPTCSDVDGDGFAVEGGNCGPMDCNDFDATVHPGADEICGDGVDQDCNGSDLACPPPACTDADQDGFAAEGGNCGPMDCNDNDPAVNPGAAERCTDGVDNNCDGKIDGQDAQACAPQPTCTDGDNDGFFAQAGCNTAQDCADSNALIFPGATEVCGDGLDNDCDGKIDEGCASGTNPDGATLYQDRCAACHGSLPLSNVCGEDTEDIMEAIAENEGGMGFLSSLSDAQVRAIAEQLANCRQGQDGQSDDRDESRDWRKRNRDRDHDRDRDRYRQRSRDRHDD